MEANGLACFDGELFLGEEKSFGDAGDLDGLKAFLSVEGGFDGVFGGGLKTVRFFEIGQSLGNGGSVL